MIDKILDIVLEVLFFFRRKRKDSKRVKECKREKGEVDEED